MALEHLFELQLQARKVFGYDKKAEGKSHVAIHAFAGFFDTVFQILGPNVEFLDEIWGQVGQKHKSMGVLPSFFPFMGQAVVHALEKFLGTELTEAQKFAWDEVYESISKEIVRSILA